MKVIFAGPSLYGSTYPLPAGSELRPPAALGDLSRAVHDGAKIIGLIDGGFETVAAVWHKEILWLLEAGIVVYGAASMGALRAAELGRFGMRGVGAIHDAYISGALEADDEVAVLHGPKELAYVPLSVALVDIGATLDAASRDGVVGPAAAASLVQRARAIFYKSRTWETVLGGESAGVSATDLQALRAWLPNGQVHRKRLDAEALLNHIAKHQDSIEPSFHAEQPRLVVELMRGLDRGSEGVSTALLDLLKLEPGAYAKRANEVLLAMLAATELKRRGDGVDIHAAVAMYRDIHGLHRAEALRAWLVARGLDQRRFEERLSLQAAADRLLDLCRPEVDDAVLDALQLEASFPKRVDAARVYSDHAEAVGRSNHAIRNPAELIVAFCRQHDIELPEAPHDLAHDLGFSSTGSLYAALRTWYYLQEQRP